MGKRGPRHGWKIIRSRNLHASLPVVAIKRVLGKLLKQAEVPGGVFTLQVETIITNPERHPSLHLARHNSQRAWIDLILHLPGKTGETITGQIIIPGKFASDEMIARLIGAAKSVFLSRAKQQGKPEQATGEATRARRDSRLQYLPILQGFDSEIRADPLIAELQRVRTNLMTAREELLRQMDLIAEALTSLRFTEESHRAHLVRRFTREQRKRLG